MIEKETKTSLKIDGKWITKPEYQREYYLKQKQLHPIKLKRRNALSQRIRRQNLKEELFRILGNKCSNPRCLVPGGCKDKRALQIDHVNGHGIKDRTECEYGTYLKRILKKIKEGSKDYQLLCANCNWIKRYEKRELIP